MKMKKSSALNSSCHFVYVITFLWFILCVYKSHVSCLTLSLTSSSSSSDLIQGNDQSQNQHAGTTDKPNSNPNPNNNKKGNDSSINSSSSDSHSHSVRVETELETECKDELTQEVCRNFVQNNLCEQKGNPNVSLCQRSCKACVGEDKGKPVDLANLTDGENVHEGESWDRKKVENKDCYDLFPNCTCRNVSNIVTCCNWINAQNLNNIPCRKSCGICGENGVFTNKPPGSSMNGNAQTKSSTNDTNGQMETRKSPTMPNFDAFCRANATIPIIEPQAANNQNGNNIVMPFPPSFPIGNQNGGTANMC